MSRNYDNLKNGVFVYSQPQYIPIGTTTVQLTEDPISPQTLIATEPLVDTC